MIRRVALPFVAVASVCCVGLMGACVTRRGQSSVDVVGGKVAPAPDYFVGLIEEGVDMVICGGAFIGPEVVATAAHCVDGAAGRLFVAPGVSQYDRVSELKTIPVKSVIIHPEYGKVGLENDVALLFLETYNKGTFPKVKTINPNTELSFPADGTPLQIMGIGNNTSFGQLMEKKFQVATVPLLKLDLCAKVPGYEGLIGPTQLCGGVLEGGIDTCSGDSGGPVVVNDGRGIPWLVGLVSFGVGCAQPGIPGVYTRMSAVSKWIRSARLAYFATGTPYSPETVGTLFEQSCVGKTTLLSSSSDAAGMSSVYKTPRLSSAFQTIPPSAKFAAFPTGGMPQCVVEGINSKLTFQVGTINGKNAMMATDSATGQRFAATVTFDRSREVTCETPDGSVYALSTRREKSIVVNGLVYPLAGDVTAKVTAGDTTPSCETSGVAIRTSALPSNVVMTVADKNDKRIYNAYLGIKQDNVSRGMVIEYGRDPAKGRDVLVASNLSKAMIYTWQMTCPFNVTLLDPASGGPLPRTEISAGAGKRYEWTFHSNEQPWSTMVGHGSVTIGVEGALPVIPEGTRCEVNGVSVRVIPLKK